MNYSKLDALSSSLSLASLLQPVLNKWIPKSNTRRSGGDLITESCLTLCNSMD